MSWSVEEEQRFTKFETEMNRAMLGSVDDPESIGILGHLRILAGAYEKLNYRVTRLEKSIIIALVIIAVPTVIGVDASDVVKLFIKWIG